MRASSPHQGTSIELDFRVVRASSPHRQSFRWCWQAGTCTSLELERGAVRASSPHRQSFRQGADLRLSPPPKPSLALIKQRINMRQQAFQHKSNTDFMTTTQQADWPIVRELIGRATFADRCNNGRTPHNRDN